MTFEPLKRILNRAVSASPVSSELKIARVFRTFQLVLRRLWDEDRAALVTPVSFKEGALKLETASPAAKQQLALDRQRLQNEINRQLGELLVTSIIVRGKGF